MPQIYFGITTDGSASVLFGSPQYSFGFEQTQRNVVLNQQTGGTITAEPMSGYDNDVVTLSNTAVAGYNFDTYNITGATLTGNQFMFNGYDVEVTPTFNRQVYTLTLLPFSKVPVAVNAFTLKLALAVAFCEPNVNVLPLIEPPV